MTVGPPALWLRCSCGLEWPVASRIQIERTTGVDKSLRGQVCVVQDEGARYGFLLLPYSNCSCLSGNAAEHVLTHFRKTP